jgi:methionine synthase I (cobalamin-dependent)
VSVTHDLKARLEIGRPLVLSGDPIAGLRARGADLTGPVAVARLLREDPETLAAHYHQEIAAGVDVLCALTADTTARGLAQIGMAFRAALLTSVAVDLALEAAELAPRPVFVAGVLAVTPAAHGGKVAHPAADRLVEEYATHAARLAAAGCQLIVARGVGVEVDAPLARIARRAAVISGAATGLPTWALLDVDEAGFAPDGESAEDWSRTALDTGAQALLVEVKKAGTAFSTLDRVRTSLPDANVGVVLAAGAGEAIEPWASDAKRLIDAGARVIGGGAGTLPRHLHALCTALRGTDRPSMWPGAM